MKILFSQEAMEILKKEGGIYSLPLMQVVPTFEPTVFSVLAPEEDVEQAKYFETIHFGEGVI
ncbi:MAG: hypothetical protein KBC48_03260 [Candidatus Pacebacteria bacterium]|nr:hypothetical protein [Candidatus Paceibacterota bacterium]